MNGSTEIAAGDQKRRLRVRIVALCMLPFLLAACGLCGLPENISYSSTAWQNNCVDCLATEVSDPSVAMPASQVLGTVSLGMTGTITAYSTFNLPLVEQRAFVGVRVPQAPPTYTVSSIISPTLQFTYHSPPTATGTTTSTAVMRRDEYVAALNTAFPIGDGHSHWEAWWLPPGGAFPRPSGPFRLSFTDYPPTVRLQFVIEFGAGSDARACAGCVIEYVFYNGFMFIGPYQMSMRLQDGFGGYALAGNPLVTFDQCLGNPPMQQGSAIVSGAAVKHVHCLSNNDTVTRTFTLDSASTQNWGYTFYTQSLLINSQPVLLNGSQVTLAPANQVGASELILTVYTPTVGLSDRFRETLTLTATSIISPDVKASTPSWAFAPAYSLLEGAFNNWLPILGR